MNSNELKYTFPYKCRSILICIKIITLGILAIAPLTNGGGALISDICAKLPYPRECFECLFKNPKAKEMGTHELVGVAEYCTYELADEVQRAFDVQATMAADFYARDTYTGCSTSIKEFSRYVATTMTLWWQLNDPTAKQTFNSAKPVYDNCKATIAELNQSRGIPFEVSDQFIKLGILYEDTYAIMLKT